MVFAITLVLDGFLFISICVLCGSDFLMFFRSTYTKFEIKL